MTIAAAIPAFNRLELLKRTVHSLRTQTRKPDEIIVINNGSIDGTTEWLSDQKDLFVLNQTNNGATGGFYSAIRVSYERQHDWIWCLDDDAVPLDDALEKLVGSPFFLPSTGFLCCRVVDPKHKTYMTPMPIDSFPRSYDECMKWYDIIGESMCVRVGNANWAGFMIGRDAVTKCGLPIKEFYIMDCDREYSERIARKMPGYCVLTSVVVHYQGKEGGGGHFRKLYHSRNKFARVMIADIPLRSKAYFIFKYSGWLVYSITFRKYPLKCLIWAFWGLFAFRPKIEFIDSQARS